MCQIKTNAKTPWYSGNKERPIILLDMDDVITNCLSAAIEAYNDKYGTKFKTSQCTSWGLAESLGVDPDDVFKLFRAKKFFEELEPKRGSISAIKKLIKSTKYDVYIITATSSDDGSELVQKLKWFKNYIPEFNPKRVISCDDKYIIRGDVIVDDKVQNLDSCKPYMQCILMDSPTNKDCENYIRIKSLKELPEILEKMFYNEDDGIRTFEKEVSKDLIKETNGVN